MRSYSSHRTVPIHVDISPEVSPQLLGNLRAFTLQNSLRVLLISTPDNSKATVALDVGVGSYKDHAYVQGLAHLVEHVVFLGSRRYPNVKEFDEFIDKASGFSNGSTSDMSTNYCFEMVTTKEGLEFREGLDRFAHFFISPSFNEADIRNEIRVIENEFNCRLDSNEFRICQVLRSCNCLTAPITPFPVGSRESLLDIPEKNGFEIVTEIRRFHDNYYSANLMTLCISAPHDLDVLQEWVSEIFSKVPNNHVRVSCHELGGILEFSNRKPARRFFVETNNKEPCLIMSWRVPSPIQDYRSMPCDLICSMLNHEGDGSLTKSLQDHNWAESFISSTTGDISSGVLRIEIMMSSTGANHIDDIIRMVYQYFNMLKETGIPRWFYEEKKTVAANLFCAFGRRSHGNMIADISKTMQYCRSRDYFSAGNLYKEYCPDKVRRVLQFVSPEHGDIVIAGTFVSPRTNMKERWTNTRYGVENVQGDVLKSWSMAGMNKTLSLPKPNPLNPTNFKILGKRLRSLENDTMGPVCICENLHMRLYHKIDRVFRIPWVFLSVLFESPIASRSPLHYVMYKIYNDLFVDSLSSYRDKCIRAGFDVFTMTTSKGFLLRISGFNDGIEKHIDYISRKMKGFKPISSRFTSILERTERHLNNHYTRGALHQASEHVDSLLLQSQWSREEQLEVFRHGKINYNKIEIFSESVLHHLHITSFAYGNISEKTFLESMKEAQKTIGFYPLPKGSRNVSLGCFQVPIGTGSFFRQQNQNPDSQNSAIHVLYQLTPRGTFKTDVIIEIVSRVLKGALHLKLRMSEQLAYALFGYMEEYNGVWGINICIQSVFQSPDYLLRRIEKFLIYFRKEFLVQMTETEFQELVNSLIMMKKEYNMVRHEEDMRQEIYNKYYQFDRYKHEIEALHLLTRNDLVHFFDNYISHNGKMTRRLVSQVFGEGNAYRNREKIPVCSTEIETYNTFRMQNPLVTLPNEHQNEISR